MGFHPPASSTMSRDERELSYIFIRKLLVIRSSSKADRQEQGQRGCCAPCLPPLPGFSQCRSRPNSLRTAETYEEMLHFWATMRPILRESERNRGPSARRFELRRPGWHGMPRQHLEFARSKNSKWLFKNTQACSVQDREFGDTLLA